MINYGEDWCGDDVIKIDKRYLCVSVEHTNFTPLAWEECKKQFEEQQ
jgi:hypothetical protein